MIKNNFDDVFYPENIEEILMKDVDEKMFDHIWRANKHFQGETAMTFFGESISYSELFSNIKEYAKALKKYGLQKGDCITLAMPNIPETVYYIYACNLIGVTAYPIDPRCTFNYMLECINNSKSKLFVCEMGTYFSKVARYADKLPVENKVVVSPVNMFEDKRGLAPKNVIAKYLYEWKKFSESIKTTSYGKNGRIFHKEFISLGNNYQGKYEAEYEPEIPAMILNTSGTTGNSVKGAMHSNRNYNMYANEAQFVTKQLVRGNSYYGYIPYFTMYGSCVGMHVALSYGITIQSIPKFSGKKSFEELIRTKSNIFIGIPTMIDKLCEMYENGHIDASHVKQYIIGGDNISPDKLKYINDSLMKLGMNTKMVYGYGTTETMPISTTNYDERSYVYGSAGMVYPMAYIKIINPDTLEELGYNEEGEIYVHNPTLMMGYLNNPSENALIFKDIDGKRYYKTGDKGYLVPSGHLFLTGRYKRLMKRPDCHQVSPIPIENALSKDPIVEDCAVVGVVKKNGGEGVIPTAFVVLKNREALEKESKMEDIIKTISEEALQNLSGERDAALAYVVVDSIPLTINGKVDFKTLQEKYFDDLDFYIIEDPATIDYFKDFPRGTFIKIDKVNIRTLKK